MPFKILKLSPNKWGLFIKDKLYYIHPTKEKALQQMKAIIINEKKRKKYIK